MGKRGKRTKFTMGADKQALLDLYALYGYDKQRAHRVIDKFIKWFVSAERAKILEAKEMKERMNKIQEEAEERLTTEKIREFSL